MKLSIILPTAATLLGIASADVEKRCTIGLDVECWYQAFYGNGDQVRCAVPGKYAIAYAYGECPSTYGGYKYAYATCITSGKFGARHKCSAPAVLTTQAKASPDGNDKDSLTFGVYNGKRSVRAAEPEPEVVEESAE